MDSIWFKTLSFVTLLGLQPWDFPVLKIIEFDKICLSPFSILKQDGEIKIFLPKSMCYFSASLMRVYVGYSSFWPNNIVITIFPSDLSTMEKRPVPLSLAYGDIFSRLSCGFYSGKGARQEMK